MGYLPQLDTLIEDERQNKANHGEPAHDSAGVRELPGIVAGFSEQYI